MPCSKEIEKNITMQNGIYIWQKNKVENFIIYLYQTRKIAKLKDYVKNNFITEYEANFIEEMMLNRKHLKLIKAIKEKL